MAAAKKANREFDMRRRLADQAAERQREAARLRAVHEQKASAMLQEVLGEHEFATRLHALVDRLGAASTPGARFGELLAWARERARRCDEHLSPAA